MPQVSINGFTAFYQDDDFADPWREHETIVLQHGYCRNGNFYRAWVPWLARDFRVLRMDMRGMGRSQDPGPNYGYTLENLAADLIAFLDAMGVEQTHYVGESLGALVGLTAAATYPGRFKSLTLVGAPLVIQPRTSATMSTGFPSWAEAIQTLGMEGHWHATRKALGEFTGDPKADTYWASEFARTPVHVGVALAKAIPGTDVSAYAPKVSVPVHLLCASESAHTDAAQQSELEQMIPQARRKTYPETFHGIYYLRPDRLAQDTLAFVREISTAQPTPRA